jgi:hypothetical protein
MTWKLDESVGRVMQALKENRILDHTIVTLVSDNGAPTTGIHPNHGSNWPLRGVRKRLSPLTIYNMPFATLHSFPVLTLLTNCMQHFPLQKLTVDHIDKRFPDLHDKQRIISLFARTHQTNSVLSDMNPALFHRPTL